MIEALAATAAEFTEVASKIVEKADKSPKEIGKAIEPKTDAPKEIGQAFFSEKRVPKEIGGSLNYNSEQTVIGRKINASFESNGYKYKTNEYGRTEFVEGKLQIKNHEGRDNITHSMSEIGKGYEKSTDERGHIIADRFNGAGNLENFVPQDAKLNKGDYKKLENQWAERVNAGDDVRVRIELKYSGDSFRPDSFIIRYSINGEQFTKIFNNG